MRLYLGVAHQNLTTQTHLRVTSTASWQVLGEDFDASMLTSLKNALNLTLAPATRQTRANMRSVEVARFWRVPVRGQAALCRPNGSSRELHPKHTASSTGRGSCGVSNHESETEDAQYCQPCCYSPGSPMVVSSGGRFPSRRSDQLGLLQNPSRSSRALASDNSAMHSTWCGSLMVLATMCATPGFLCGRRVDARCPVRCRCAPTCGSHSQTAWQRGDLPRNFSFPFLARRLLEKGLHDVPFALVMVTP